MTFDIEAAKAWLQAPTGGPPPGRVKLIDAIKIINAAIAEIERLEDLNHRWNSYSAVAEAELTQRRDAINKLLDRIDRLEDQVSEGIFEYDCLGKMLSDSEKEREALEVRLLDKKIAHSQSIDAIRQEIADALAEPLKDLVIGPLESKPAVYVSLLQVAGQRLNTISSLEQLFNERGNKITKLQSEIDRLTLRLRTEVKFTQEAFGAVAQYEAETEKAEAEVERLTRMLDNLEAEHHNAVQVADDRRAVGSAALSLHTAQAREIERLNSENASLQAAVDKLDAQIRWGIVEGT